MYNLPYYKAGGQQEVIDFMHRHTFIILCGCNADKKPVATHVPVLIEEREGKLFLVGHIMKQTDHYKAFVQNHEVLAIFTGPHTYVSASWYVHKQQGSTWNYLTVHAKGTMTFLDEAGLLNVLTKLTTHYENNDQSPSLIDKLSENYMQKMMKAIVAFEIEVTTIDHVFKLSQDRDEESYQNIIDKLKDGDGDSKQIASLMEQKTKK